MRRLQDLVPGLLMTGLGIGFMVLTFHVNGIPTILLWGTRLLSVVIMIGGFSIVKGALAYILLMLLLLYIMKLNQFAIQAFVIWGFPIVFVLYKFIREVIRLIQTLRDEYFKVSVQEAIQNIKDKMGK